MIEETARKPHKVFEDRKTYLLMVQSSLFDEGAQNIYLIIFIGFMKISYVNILKIKLIYDLIRNTVYSNFPELMNRESMTRSSYFRSTVYANIGFEEPMNHIPLVKWQFYSGKPSGRNGLTITRDRRTQSITKETATILKKTASKIN